MTLLERDREKKEEANIETAINLLNLNILDEETIAASVGLPLEVVQKLKREIAE